MQKVTKGVCIMCGKIINKQFIYCVLCFKALKNQIWIWGENNA
jgi:hypothetical protein